jgi:hypothetical protein
MSAHFILDETQKAWFVGAADVITQRVTAQPASSSPTRQPRHAAAAAAAAGGAGQRVRVNPTLQLKHGRARMGEATCMGDYCSLELEAHVEVIADRREARRLAREREKSAERTPQPLPGGSLGDLVLLADGRLRSLKTLEPKERRGRVSANDGSESEQDGDDEEEESAAIAEREAAKAAASQLPASIEAALCESGKAVRPTRRVAYRSILLDRTLRSLGIQEDDPAPRGVLEEFEERVRRRTELHYKQAHVCEACACWYERQARRRAAELDSNHSPLTSLLQEETASSTAAALAKIAERRSAATAARRAAAAHGSPAHRSLLHGGTSSPASKQQQQQQQQQAATHHHQRHHHGGTAREPPASFARAVRRSELRTSSSLPEIQPRA